MLLFIAAVVVACIFFGMFMFAPNTMCALKQRNQLKDCNEVSVGEYIRTSKTGDLIMFRHDNTPFLHDVVSIFSHVGITIKHPVTGFPYILESFNEGDAKDIGIRTGGVHLTPLPERIRAYVGKVWVCAINRPPPTSRVIEVVQPDLFKIPFDTDFITNFLTCKICPQCTKPSYEKMFCSVFAIETMKRLGIVRGDARSDCASPLDVLRAPLTENYAYARASLLVK